MFFFALVDAENSAWRSRLLTALSRERKDEKFIEEESRRLGRGRGLILDRRRVEQPLAQRHVDDAQIAVALDVTVVDEAGVNPVKALTLPRF